MVLRLKLATLMLTATGLLFSPTAPAISLSNCGEPQTFTAPPKRIVVYGNPALENLLALGARTEIVGVVGYAPHKDPQGRAARTALSLPVVAGNGLISAEALLLLRPEMVYSSSWYWLWSPEGATRDQMTAWGISSWLSPGACTGQQSAPQQKISFADLFREIEDLAKILRLEKQGKALVSMAKVHLATLRQRACLLPPVRLLWWYSGTDSPYVAGCCGVPEMLSEESGSRNIFSDVPALWPNISWEEIARRDPDILVLADLPRGGAGDSAGDKIAFLNQFPLTAGLRAVKEKKFIILSGYDMDPSIRSLDALDRLIASLSVKENHD
ncbi:ABC-type hemin transport system, periplasmic component [Cedecea davisae]|uniref:Periplasmic binding protein n=1 Tax=Cedecea davisae DSM 4568 TaxID=566551 RepID=S3J896_9ENTR|nr:periplasmic binding protein [Cedecea davisae DSM 4568]SUX38930.1 ABC-type hemin transport system, periplasmic component [Cedecea davisae]